MTTILCNEEPVYWEILCDGEPVENVFLDPVDARRAKEKLDRDYPGVVREIRALYAAANP